MDDIRLIKRNKIVFPVELKDSQLQSCKVFASRRSAMHLIPKGSRFLEVGVAAGDYSYEFSVLNNPSSVTLLDRFTENDYMVGVSKGERFTRETHVDFIKDRFKDFNTTVIQGMIQDVLPNLTGPYDYIYLDADSTAVGFGLELRNAVRLCSENGIIGINDYAMVDYVHNVPFAVVHEVNKFMEENPEWHMIGFAIENTMFCDVYIQKMNMV